MNGFAFFLTVVFVIVVFAGGGYLYADNRQLRQESAALQAQVQNQQQENIEIAGDLTTAQNENGDLQRRLEACRQQPASLQMASTAPQAAQTSQASAQPTDKLLILTVFLALGGVGMVVTAGGCAYLKLNSH